MITDKTEPRAENLPGIYIHVPFCRRKCAYCDFYSVASLELIPAYTDALIAEINRTPPGEVPANTFYFGGGTPSVLPVLQLERIINALSGHFPLASDVQISLEANPGTVSRELLRAYRKLGIDRINFGVQSFRDVLLRKLGRLHDRKTAIAAVDQAAEAGFSNIGIDLMYGLPGQSCEDLKSDLDQALEMPVNHLSCYSLTYEPGTVLYRQRESGDVIPLEESIVADQVLLTYDTLVFAGFDAYEISNYARCEPDQPVSPYRSRHNMKYWTGAPYIGLGPGSHSFDGSTRRHWNHPDLAAYIRNLSAGKLPDRDVENLTPDQKAMEAVYLGLRVREGICLPEIECLTDVPVQEPALSFIRQMESEGYLKYSEGRFSITRNGRLYLDTIVSRIVDLLP